MTIITNINFQRLITAEDVKIRYHDVEFTTIPTRSSYFIGEAIVIKMSLRNIGEKSVKLYELSAPMVTMVIKRKDGTGVFYITEILASCSIRELRKNESLERTISCLTWFSPPEEAGQYVLEIRYRSGIESYIDVENKVNVEYTEPDDDYAEIWMQLNKIRKERRFEIQTIKKMIKIKSENRYLSSILDSVVNICLYPKKYKLLISLYEEIKGEKLLTSFKFIVEDLMEHESEYNKAIEVLDSMTGIDDAGNASEEIAEEIKRRKIEIKRKLKFGGK